MKAREVMTCSPNCCLPTVSARMAAGLLARFGVGFLPVVDDYCSRKLLGVITDRDLCVRVLATRSDADEVAVWDCMTRSPACCPEDADVEQVLTTMLARGVRRIPVVDEEETLLGIVSIDDLVRHRAVSAERICEALQAILGGTSDARVTAGGV